MELSCPYVVENWHIINLVKRSIIISSDQHLLQIELDYLRKAFIEINDYPSKAVENIIKNEGKKGNVNITNERQTSTTGNSEAKLVISSILGKARHSVTIQNEKVAKEKYSVECENMHYIRRHKTFNTISCER